MILKATTKTSSGKMNKMGKQLSLPSARRNLKQERIGSDTLRFEPGTYLDQKEKLINSDFVYKELTVFNGRSSAVNTFDYKWYVCIQSTSFFTRFLIPKDDDILLDYLNEDGQSIEPTWYMPIIPMLVVNGSEGIGIGWSSNILNYSLRDIVANVRHL
ncbi:hypothetical protein RHGRI_013373 [Rhododendron griersonianum]|uniref:DNA topoisomerase (ATP-hydrolyzing) n=1 Tax=Rhododendron griersonianum TaxID=479676 RepID=A0AAV6K5L6_9ERIC|nr:hypothetical protein RHGRI_013373 [Rhododendron griersonianum]